MAQSNDLQTEAGLASSVTSASGIAAARLVIVGFTAPSITRREVTIVLDALAAELEDIFEIKDG